jgi:hypothetical protein
LPHPSRAFCGRVGNFGSMILETRLLEEGFWEGHGFSRAANGRQKMGL